MTNRFTEEEISRLHLLGRMLARTRNFATSPLNKAGRFHLLEMLDCAHNLPGALLNPEHYDIADDMEYLRKLLETMDNPIFLQKDSADEDKAWTIDAFKIMPSDSQQDCLCDNCLSVSIQEKIVNSINNSSQKDEIDGCYPIF